MSAIGGPNIVEDGLVLALDSANTKSYPGSGTTWNDLSGNGNNGTLINGPTFNSDNLGSIVFDGVDDTVNILGPASRYFPIIDFTIECVVKTNQTTRNGFFSMSYGIILRHSGAAGTLQFRLDNGSSIPTFSPPISSPNINDNKWHICNIVVKGGDSATIDFFIDGIYYGQRTTSWSGVTRWPTNSVGLGRDNNNSSRSRYVGEISLFKIYNRALTASEIQQNYNAKKSRYEL